jgi:hypothetical protein
VPFVLPPFPARTVPHRPSGIAPTIVRFGRHPRSIPSGFARVSVRPNFAPAFQAQFPVPDLRCLGKRRFRCLPLASFSSLSGLTQRRSFSGLVRESPRAWRKNPRVEPFLERLARGNATTDRAGGDHLPYRALKHPRRLELPSDSAPRKNPGHPTRRSTATTTKACNTTQRPASQEVGKEETSNDS